MLNMRINPGHAAKHRKHSKTAAQETDNAERADGQRETNKEKRKIGKGGFVRDGFG